MSDFEITILGNGSAVPTSWQNPSAQMVRYGRHRFLIDCGEGTQMQMIRYGVSYSNLSHIFISHLHGDHFLGVAGLLSTLHLYGRQKALHIFAPQPLKEILRLQFEVSHTRLHFPLLFHVLPESGLLYEDTRLEIRCFPLKHSVPAYGFLLKEKPGKRNLKKDFVKKYHPGIEQMQRIKQGDDFVLPDGTVLPNREITKDPVPPRSYAYCSDTAYDEKIIPFIRGVDLLYHEATFDDSLAALAAEKFHSTARQAATIAAKAGAKKLLLGHFSARFRDADTMLLLEEARQVFPHTFLSRQGEVYFPGE